MFYINNELGNCPDCNSTELCMDHIRAEITCKKCGCVLEANFIDYGVSGKPYETENSNENDQKGGMGSLMSKKDIAKYTRNTRHWAVLTDRHNWVTKGADKALEAARKKLKTFAEKEKVPATVVAISEKIYHKAAKKNLVKGRTVERVLAVGIYAGYKEIGNTRSIDEIGQMWGIPKRDLSRDVRLLNRKLRLKIGNSSAETYVEPMASKLRFDPAYARQAKKLAAMSWETQEFSGKSPKCIAAASIYVVSRWNNVRLPQTEIAESTGVSCPTIKRLSDNLERMFKGPSCL